MRGRHHLWLLPVAVLVHRGMLFVRHGADLNALFLANPSWIVVQLHARQALDDQPWAALWFLQQSPPIPNALVAGLLQISSWPLGIGWWLVAFQVLCTLAIALLLAEIGRRVVPSWAATGLGLLWILSPDVVVLETTGIGQVFYENLAALGVLASLYACLRWHESALLRWAVGAGLLVGLLALTRSSYAYSSLVLVAAMWARSYVVDPVRRRAALRYVAWFAAVALCVQGAWALKNLLVFGHWTWPASTWGGASLAASTDGIGAGDDLVASILAESHRYEPWFVEFVERNGARPWTYTWQDESHCPAKYREHDSRVTERLNHHNRRDNSQCLRGFSKEFGNASIRFLSRRPDVLARKLKLAYATYWFPIRYHGGQYLSLFSVDWRVERSLRPWRGVRQLLSGDLPEPAYVTIGTWPDTVLHPARLFTLDRLAVVWWMVELLVLHLVTPIVLIVVAYRVLRNRRLAESRDFLVLAMALTYLYSAGVHNLVEFGENMRFRWNVEPVIWLLVADSVARCLRVAVRQRSTRRSVPVDGPS